MACWQMHALVLLLQAAAPGLSEPGALFSSQAREDIPHGLPCAGQRMRSSATGPGPARRTPPIRSPEHGRVQQYPWVQAAQLGCASCCHTDAALMCV